MNTLVTEFILKWIGTIVVILATVFLSFGSPALAKALFLVGSIAWTIVGFMWNQPSVWLLNIVLATVYIAGYLTP